MGMFFIKIMKIILITEVRSSQKHPSKRPYLLLLIAVLPNSHCCLGSEMFVACCLK
ncbi:hypothetical protein NC652_040006 [Populus alba x Populus x berolinensis]|nr:hypothetical protein NC652_040006 [Populus alba x Populus x berolinensis]